MELTSVKSDAWTDITKSPNKNVPNIGKSDINVQEGNPEKSALGGLETVESPEKSDLGDVETVNKLKDQLLTLEIHSPDEMSGETHVFYFYLKSY